MASKAGNRLLTTSAQKPRQLWEAVLGELQLQVSRPSYKTWLKDTVGLSHGDGEFVVLTPNTFVAEMLEQRMYSVISKAMAKVVDGGVEVRFQTVAEGSLAVGQTEAGPGPQRVRRDPQEDAQAIDHAVPARANGHAGRRPAAAGLNARYTFEHFVVGNSNELAQAAALAVAERPGFTYNPLFIYSGVGLGKTHLLHAIGHLVLSRGLSLIYATTEEFTNEFIKAIREGKTEGFRNRYRSADVLLLDDIQFIIGKEQTQEGFFHTFNALHMAGRQVVITSDRPATDLTLLEDRIQSRLAGGLVVDIQAPDLETKLAILAAKAEETGQSLPNDVLDFLAGRIHSNIRELEGCLNRLAAYAQITARTITLDLVQGAVADILRPASRRRLSDTVVLETVCAYYSVDKETILGRLRDKHTALARQVAMYLLREESNLPLASIGRLLGGRDHSTVLHACRRISGRIGADTHLRSDLANIRETLSSP